MKICPCCEQDAVWLVRIIGVPEHQFLMCFECDSVWEEGEPITTETGSSFDDHMKAIRCETDWKAVERIKMVD